jgi:Flp pilus assembly pilin Flp
MRIGRLRSELGASAAEMAFVLVLIVVVAFGAVRLFGFQLQDLWQGVAQETTNVNSPSDDDDRSGGGGNAGGGGSGIPGFPDPTTTTTSTTTTTTTTAP